MTKQEMREVIENRPGEFYKKYNLSQKSLEEIFNYIDSLKTFDNIDFKYVSKIIVSEYSQSKKIFTKAIMLLIPFLMATTASIFYAFEGHLFLLLLSGLGWFLFLWILFLNPEIVAEETGSVIKDAIFKKFGFVPSSDSVEIDNSIIFRRSENFKEHYISDLHIGKFGEKKVEVFNYTKVILEKDKSGREYNSSDFCTVVRIKFEKGFPQMLLANTSLGFAQNYFDNTENVNIFGDFEKDCYLRVVKGNHLAGVQLFTPDILDEFFGENSLFKNKGLLTIKIGMETVDNDLLFIDFNGETAGGLKYLSFLPQVKLFVEKYSRPFDTFISEKENTEIYFK